MKPASVPIQLLLKDLWQSSVFDPDSYKLLEAITQKIAISQSKQNAIEELEHDFSLQSFLSTLRNRNLISYDQQKKLQQTTVACFGLSVGSHAVITWMMESRANTVKILDPDTIDPSNLNRLRFGWETVGQKKSEVVKEEIERIHPGVTVFSWSEISSIEEMFEPPNIHCIIDAIDDIEGKIFLRTKAKMLKIPLISAADVGDNVILDIERYDQRPVPKPFLGRISQKDIQHISSLSDIERRKLIIKLVGFHHNSEKLLESLYSIGKSLPTWPQLGATATVAGGVIATTIKKIVLGENVKSGRYIISLDSLLDQSFNTWDRKIKRVRLINKVKEKFSL